MSCSTKVSSLKKIDLLGLLTVGLYVFLTLLPDSGTIMLSWPWVIVWEIMLILPWLWVIKHWWRSKSFTRLGYGLDYGAGLAIIGLLGSSLFVPFPQQAIWYSWAGFSAMMALYGLNTWCSNQDRRALLLYIQGGLGSILILFSLWLWGSQTVVPELERLNILRSSGLDFTYDFSTLELRNWAPFGHQNYVAGYLVLCLPLLLGQCLIAKNRLLNIGWGLSVVLGVVTLFTTSSRGGLLGLSVALGFGIFILLFNRQSPMWLRISPSIILVSILSLALITNNRLRHLLTTNPLENNLGDSYRLITHVTGWLMGQDYPIFGAGPGSVQLLFQKYRPSWAGLEAEWHFQLHSTPVNIWAEFGSWGILLSIGIIGWLVYWGSKLWRSPNLKGSDRILCWSILAGLLGYCIVCLTDYQLDIIAISGTLIVYSVCLLSLLRDTIPTSRKLVWTTPKLKVLIWSATGLLIAMCLWLAPILWAWQLSSVGFTALQNQKINTFFNALERSHQLAPWEPYYLHQLGLHSGKIGQKIKDPKLKNEFLQQSKSYLQKSTEVSPYQEFGYSSLGWLQLETEPAAALQSFTQATRLVPGRRLAFQGLGLSLLNVNQPELAIQAFALEIMRNPLWMTSPIWRSEPLNPLYPQVLNLVEHRYQQLLAQTKQPDLKKMLHQCLGGLYWWQGNDSEAETQWQLSHSQLGLDLIAIDQGKLQNTKVPIFQAWLDNKNRTQWIEKALLHELKKQPEQQKVNAIVNSMNKASSFKSWLQEMSPTVYSWRTRTGFGVVSRHIDGPAPQDFASSPENYAFTSFFANLLTVPVYSYDFDLAAQPYQDELWTAIDNLKS